jgi:uncharacterized protein (DUF2236 family)
VRSPDGGRTGSLNRLAEVLRGRIVSGVTSPFGHAPYPLANSLEYGGDPGLLGPGSVSWMVLADVAAFVGGIRALLVQSAHPEVVAGVGDHSRYREDPLGRLSRTSAYVTATTFGAIPEVERAVEQVKRIHRIVSGISSRGIPYDADDPGFSAWVHNALTDSFLVAHQAYGGIPLSPVDEDRFVREQAKVGALLGADPMPDNAVSLARWIELHPDLAPSREMREAVDFLIDPPLEPALKLGYRVLLEAALVTMPRRLLQILGLGKRPGAKLIGRASVGGLRWALGYSPTWRLALLRTDAEIPEGLFTQPLPPKALSTMVET